MRARGPASSQACWFPSLAQVMEMDPPGISYAGVLANLFVHYAFGTWRAQQFPTGLLRGPAGRPMRAWKGSAQHE